MKGNETIAVTTIFITSAFIINLLLLLFWGKDGINLETVPMLKNVFVFFSLLLIASASNRIFYSMKKNKDTYYFKTLYNTILENTDVGLAIMDKSNRFEFANPQFKHFLQMDRVPMAGRNASDVLPKSVYRLIMEYRLLSEDSLENSISRTIHFKDSYVNYTIFRIKDKNGHFKYITTSQNHTDLINMEQKLKDQLSEIEFHAEAKEALLANVSHELKTPLNAIIGLNHILEGTALDPRQKEIVTKINASSDFLLSLINDVLDFSKIKHGALTMYPSHFRLEDLLLDIREIFYPITAQRGLKFQEDYRFDSNLGLHLDRVRLEQVLVNLINNSCKFTEVGYVKVHVYVLQELQDTITLKLSVEDTGIGIDCEEIPGLFKEFHQIENHLTKLHQGTGLGLPICKHLVENMGGALWVESQKGMGSTFFFTVTAPKYYQEAKTEHVPALSPVLYAHGEKVLVVEDTLINYEVVEELLSAVNISCDHAADGFSALEMCERVGSGYYKVILMDIHMPRMDGYETSRRLKAIGVTSPIVALTASNIDDATKGQYSEVISDFIQKPFKHTQLYGALLPYFQTGPSADRTEPPDNPYGGKDIAIANLGGSVDFYEKHLAKFKKNYVNAGDTMNGYINDGNWEDAKILSHSIKGLAGMLGLPYLEDAARDLENTISTDDGDLPVYATLFCERLKQVVGN